MNKSLHIMLVIAVTLSAVLLITVPVKAMSKRPPDIRVTHSQASADQPDAVVDANGNIHIVYCDDYYTSSIEIWYTMLDNKNNTIIQDTQLTDDDGYDSMRPAIGIDSNNRLHIVFKDQRWDSGSSQEITYTKIDPYIDDQDGDAADSTTITVIDDLRLSNEKEWYIHNSRMAIDRNDDIHIVWDNADKEKIYYMKIDEDGMMIGRKAIRSAAQWKALPDIDVDANCNLHLTWSDYQNTDSDEVYYMMLDNCGDVLIDATQLTFDDNNYSKWSAIAVDYLDNVHIVFQDHQGIDDEIYYIQLDPSLDDQSGDAAHAATIITVGVTALTQNDGVKSRFPAIASGGHGQQLHITWEESLGPDIHYMVLDYNGNTLVSNTALTTNGTAGTTTDWTIPYLNVNADAKAHVVWSDYRIGNNEIYFRTYQGPSPDLTLVDGGAEVSCGCTDFVGSDSIGGTGNNGGNGGGRSSTFGACFISSVNQRIQFKSIIIGFLVIILMMLACRLIPRIFNFQNLRSQQNTL